MKAFEIMCEGYRYVGNCTDKSTAPHLADMMDQARPITFRTFVKAVGLESIRQIFGDYQWGHGKDIRMKNDPYVTYFRSKFKGDPCYYVRHSGIEYIFVEEDALPKDSDGPATIPISPNQWSITGDGQLHRGLGRAPTFYGTKTPTSLSITSTSEPSKNAAATLTRMIKQSKLEVLNVDDDEEAAKDTLKWLSQFL